MPATDGRTVVWIDQRYHAGADPENPNNQEVVAYDIATKTTTRITFTDNAKPSAKWNPDVEGDWVAWTDDRDSDFPNSTQDIPKNRADIYGYRLDLKREFHLLGNHAGTLTEDEHNLGSGLQPRNPRLHRGKLYVIGAYPDDGNAHLQVWEIALPQPKE